MIGWGRIKALMLLVVVPILLLVTHNSDAVAGQPEILLKDLKYAYSLDLQGDILTWSNYADVYTYNLKTKEQRKIISDKRQSYSCGVWGNQIVGREEGETITSLWVYDLKTSRKTTINSDANLREACIYENKILYRLGNESVSLVVYDLTTHTNHFLPLPKSTKINLNMYGDKVVWVDFRNAFPQVYMYDLKTKRERQLTNTNDSKKGLKIFKDKVVYVRLASKADGVYLYDLKTGKEKRLSEATENPQIFDQYVIWQSDETKLYLHNLVSNRTVEVGKTGSVSENYVLWGNRVVWFWSNQNPFSFGDLLCYTIDLKDKIAPKIVPGNVGGTYPIGVSVALQPTEPSAIYYTTDGTNPSVKSKRYNNPLTFSNNVTLKYLAIDFAGNMSSIGVQKYVIKGKVTVQKDPIRLNSSILVRTGAERDPYFFIVDGHPTTFSVNTIVYSHASGNDFNLYSYDRRSGRVSQLTYEAGNERSPALWGNRMAYIKDVSNSVYVRDLSSGLTQVIGNGSFAPQIMGENVLWQEKNDLVLYNLQTQQKRTVASSAYPYYEYEQSMWGGWVVYQRRDTNGYAVMLYDIQKDTTIKLVEGIKIPPNPRIWGNRIVWLVGKNQSTAGVYLYDLQTKKIRRLDTWNSPKSGLVMGESDVVWVDGRSGSQIMAFDFKANKEIVLMPKYFGTILGLDNKSILTGRWGSEGEPPKVDLINIL